MANLKVVNFNQSKQEAVHAELALAVSQTQNQRMEMFKGIGHDLRTPLASLKLMLEMLQTKRARLKEEQIDEMLESSQNEISYLTQLVEDLLVLAVAEDSHSNLNQEKVNVVETLKEEVKMLKPIAELQGKRIHFSSHSVSDFCVSSDPQMIKRMARNILANALSFATANVWVNLVMKDGQMVLEFRDDGPGMNEEMIKTYGEPKPIRIQRGRFEGRASMGLGATIVKAIVKGLKAQMRAFNQGGAVIEIVFASSVPLIKAAA